MIYLNGNVNPAIPPQLPNTDMANLSDSWDNLCNSFYFRLKFHCLHRTVQHAIETLFKHTAT